MPIYVQLGLIFLSLYSFVIRKIHTDISWVSIYYNGFVNILFLAYFAFFNSLFPGFLNIAFIIIFSIMFIKQSAMPIKERIHAEEESDSIVDIHNLKKIISIINTSPISGKIHVSFIFEILMLGTYQPKYMLKVLSFLIGKGIISLTDQNIIVNKHIGFFTRILLSIGIIPPHEKVEINIYQ